MVSRGGLYPKMSLNVYSVRVGESCKCGHISAVRFVRKQPGQGRCDRRLSRQGMTHDTFNLLGQRDLMVPVIQFKV